MTQVTNDWYRDRMERIGTMSIQELRDWIAELRFAELRWQSYLSYSDRWSDDLVSDLAVANLKIAAQTRLRELEK